MEYLPRFVDREIQELLDVTPVLVLEGARATGKTTTAERHTRSAIRLPHDLELLLSDPVSVLTRLEKPALIDEWQLAGVDLLWALKAIVDADPTPGQFVLAGSVEPESYGPTYPLTGRSARIVMRPMTRRELDGHGGESLWLDRLVHGELSAPSASFPRFELAELFTTGFPAATPTSNQQRWLRSYAASVSERGVDERRDPVRVARTLRVLAELESQALPDERVWTSADINRATFAAYDVMLQRAHVSVPTPTWATNRLKRLTEYPKRHLVDAALALAIAGVDLAALERDPALAGRYLESFVTAQLRAEADCLDGDVAHVRSRGGEHEIDIVIDIAGRLIAIEIKSGVDPRRTDARHLRWFIDQLHGDVIAGCVLHRGTHLFQLEPDIWAIPISSLWSHS